MKNSFLQLMSRQEEAEKPKAEEKPEAKAEEKSEAKAEEKPEAKAEEKPEAKAEENKKVPLIDEELFSGEADKSEAEENVFETEPIADDIPDGVDVPEHDAEAKTA